MMTDYLHIVPLLGTFTSSRARIRKQKHWTTQVLMELGHLEVDSV